MSVVELLKDYGSAFWKSSQVDVRQKDDNVFIRHPGFFDTVEMSFDMMADFNDVDAAVLMSCKPTGRHGYASCFRREVLVRPTGDAQTEQVLRPGEMAVLAELVHDDLRYRLGPASTVLQLVFSHLYPLDMVRFASEYSIRVEPAYTESIRDDDLTRRLSQMQGHQRIEQLRSTGDEGIRRFLIELSSVLNIHLQIWDVPEALEYAYMESQRRLCVDNPHRIAQVFPYRTGVDLYLRAIQVNEPHLRVLGLLQVIESHYMHHAYEGTLSRLRERLTSHAFDAANDDHLLELLAEASRAHSWRDDTEEILAELLDKYVDRDELAAGIRDLMDEEVVETLCAPEELSRFLHDVRDLVTNGPLLRRSRVLTKREAVRSYLPLIQWITVTIMRGYALDEELAAAAQPPPL